MAWKKLRAYLWGVETNWKGQSHLRLAALRAYLWGVETLGWSVKILSHVRLRAYLWGVETYTAQATRKHSPFVASLPMRSWNFDNNRQHLTLMFELRAYLWGVETHSTGDITTSLSYVASLPMRSWNVSRGIDFMGYRIVASLPMRSWNVCKVVRRLQPLALRAYLWGVETTIE